MKAFRLVLSLGIVAMLFAQCQKDEMEDAAVPEAQLKSGNVPEGMYTVTVENVSTPYEYFEAGAQTIPEGHEAAGPAFPGETFIIQFHAGRNHRLSFALMYGASNDWFYAPDDEGIALFSGNDALEGDITDMISLWDAGTEVDGSGTPGTTENETIEMESTLEENIQVHLDYDNVSMFTLTIHVLQGSATPLSPVAWVIHNNEQTPIFEMGGMASSELESIAETGNAAPLAHNLSSKSGYVSPIAPVLWVLHDKKDMPVFTEGSADYGWGLETLAETGNPSELNETLIAMGYESGFMAGPGAPDAPPIFPGQMIQFTIEGHVGQSLSIASMLGASNDIFFSFSEKGIKLDNGMAEKDLTHFIELYDAGTEVNEYPGAGYHQGGPEGPDENGVVRVVDDEFMWPDPSQVIKVTIKKN